MAGTAHMMKNHGMGFLRQLVIQHNEKGWSAVPVREWAGVLAGSWIALSCGKRGNPGVCPSCVHRIVPECAHACLGEASMDLVERSFAVAALTSYFVLIALLAYLVLT